MKTARATAFRRGWVGCPECGLYIQWAHDPDGAIANWNRRAGTWTDARTSPKEPERYLVMLKTEGDIGFYHNEWRARILRFTDAGWRLPRHFPEEIHKALTQTVTHWMPLPEPPKDASASYDLLREEGGVDA